MTQATPTPDLSIVVISYNTADMTVAALKSVFDTAGDINFELLVCDNQSRDGSAEAIEAAFPQELGKRLILIRSGGNLGFARANNVMAGQARGRWILLLNPDTIVLPNALQNLLAFAVKTPDARIWGGRTYLGDGTLDPASVWRKMSLWSLVTYTFGIQKLFPNSAVFNPEAYGGWDRLTEREVDIVTGCYLLIDADLWRALGGFDRRFFMYAEEADLCLRARALGARPRFTPTSEIIHFGGASEQVYSGKMVKLFAGKLTLAEKHLPAWQVWLARGLLATAVCGRSIALRGLGALSGRDRWRRSGQEWAAVWQRRDEWLRGYPEPSAEATG
jgi:GT2 family glycosyltransferase